MSTIPKEIIFEDEARELLKTGIKKLSDVVIFTYGPGGRNVGLQKSWGAPTITNDGSSTVKDVELEDKFENMGASMTREVVEKIKQSCGDGTTLGVLLLDALVDSGVKHIATGISPINVKRGIDKAVDAIIKELENQAIQVQTPEQLRNIAIVSANGNKEIGDIIADAIEKVGKSGVITIEQGKGTTTTIDLVEGMQFDRGYISSYLCTNMEKLIVEMQNPKILITEKKISTVHDILPILESTATSGSELLIIADDIEDDALSTLVMNKLRGTLKVCAVKAPGFGDRRKAMLQDLAVLTGATLVSDDTGIQLKEMALEMLGTCEKVTVTKDTTTIVDGAGLEEDIKSRINQIENEINASTSTYEKEKLSERKAKLSGGVAVIKVGATTEPEMKQKKQIFEDSLNSTRAAQEMGIVPGGGIALLRATHVLKDLELNTEERAGADTVKKASESPVKQIAKNAGFDGSVILSEIVSSKDANYGFNVVNETYENMISASIVDPVKVIITALRFAASTAGIVLLSEVLIADADEEQV